MHSKCCRGRQGAISQVSWDNAYSSCATLLASDRKGSRSKIFNTVRNLKEQTQMKTIKNFLKDESGMETLEYAVIAGLIALVAVAIYATSGTWKATLQNRLENAAAQN